jgi:hypothetical protein
MDFTHLCHAIHGDINSLSGTSTLPSYYLHARVSSVRDKILLN